jgi:hypothetical protein
MYYFSLRNYGYHLIQQGNLEGGIYQLTLAERFGPLDRDSNGVREGARYYLIGASFWELNWREGGELFRPGVSRLVRPVGWHHDLLRAVLVGIHALWG